MTTDDKTAISSFLGLAGDYLRDGHARNREYCVFDEDPPAEPEEKISLPLAYTVDEDDVNSDDAIDAIETIDSTGNDTIEAVTADIAACRACGLAAARAHTVAGEGVPNPLVMVIGEGPGADEDAAGRPFVGKAGQLLDRMLASIGLSREKNCYIANMVKCRPPGNRDPEQEELAACFPFLERQILTLKPKLILCVGRVASQSLLKTREGINALRGRFVEFSIGTETAIPLLPSYHPSAILRDETLRRPAWEDLKLLRARLESLDLD